MHGRVAVVTGEGQRCGIGAVICRAFGEKGADIFFTYWGYYEGSVLPLEDESPPDSCLRTARHGS